MEDKNPLSIFHVPKDRPLRELKDVGFLSGMSYRIIHLRNRECVFLSFFDFTQFNIVNSNVNMNKSEIFKKTIV
jgi:hypothetical protein